MTEKKKRQHYWTITEQRILRDFYPMEGMGVAERLPGRSEQSIRSTASIMRLKFVGQRVNPRKKWEATPAIDALIRQAWGEGYQRGISSHEVAEKTGYPAWWIKRRACALGLSVRMKRDPPWKEEEESLLRELAHLDLEVIRRNMAAAGFRRTRTAIQIRRKRMGLSCRPARRYCANQLGQLLGLDPKCVARWITNGWIHAETAETERTPQQGGDIKWVDHADVRLLIINNPHLVDLRKVTDQGWFIGLLGGKPADGRQHKRKTPAAVYEETDYEQEQN